MVGRDLNEKFPRFETGVKEMPGNFKIDTLSVLIDMMDPKKSLKNGQNGQSGDQNPEKNSDGTIPNGKEAEEK